MVDTDTVLKITFEKQKNLLKTRKANFDLILHSDSHFKFVYLYYLLFICNCEIFLRIVIVFFLNFGINSLYLVFRLHTSN